MADCPSLFLFLGVDAAAFCADIILEKLGTLRCRPCGEGKRTFWDSLISTETEHGEA